MGEVEAVPSALPHAADPNAMPIPTKIDVTVRTATTRDRYTPSPLHSAASTDRSKHQSLRQSFQATSALSASSLDLEVQNTNLTEEHLANVPAGTQYGRGLSQISSEQALSRNTTNKSYIVMASERSTHSSTESDPEPQASTGAVPPPLTQRSNNHSESEESKARSNNFPQPNVPVQKMQSITKTEQESSSKLPLAAQASSSSPALPLSRTDQVDLSSHANTSHSTPDTSGEHVPTGQKDPNGAQKSNQIGTGAQPHEDNGNQLYYIQRFQKKQQSSPATPEKPAESQEISGPVAGKYGGALDELQGLIFEPTPPASEPSNTSYQNAEKDQSETKPSKEKGQGVVGRNNKKQTVEKRGVAGVDANFLSGMFQTEMENIEYYKSDLFGGNNLESSQASRHRNAHLAEATKQHVTIFLERLADGEIEAANYDGLLRFVTALQDRDYKTAQSLMTDGLQAKVSGSMQEGFPWMVCF